MRRIIAKHDWTEPIISSNIQFCAENGTLGAERILEMDLLVFSVPPPHMVHGAPGPHRATALQALWAFSAPHSPSTEPLFHTCLLYVRGPPSPSTSSTRRS